MRRHKVLTVAFVALAAWVVFLGIAWLIVLAFANAIGGSTP
jgi:hypothetical protein